jgi:hypothetical protein
MSPTEIVRAALEEHGRPAWLGHVPFRIVKQVPAPVLEEMLAGARRSTPRGEKEERYAAFDRWLSEHLFDEVTIPFICERLEISVGHARRFIADRPDQFRKIGRGVWEVRDPREDRKRDRAGA